jgi:hypothetical protein
MAAVLACRALMKCVGASTKSPPPAHVAAAEQQQQQQPNFSLTPAESAALLAAVASSSSPSSDEDDTDGVKLCAMRLLRSEAARLEHHHADAVEFGRGGGVKAAVRPMAEWVAATLRGDGEGDASGKIKNKRSGGWGGGGGKRDDDGGEAGEPRGGESTSPVREHRLLRLAVEGAAALADMVAAAGTNKSLALTLGGVDALVGCVERLNGPRTAAAAGKLETELAVQACRALGNLTYGWDVDQIKEAIGARGAAAVVAVTAPRGEGPSSEETAASAPALFRWQAHALRNFCVRSPAMQDAVGGSAHEHHRRVRGETAGDSTAVCGADALRRGLRAHVASPRAQETGCKALAYVIQCHDGNLAAAGGASLELAVGAMKAHPRDAAVVEAALTLINSAVGPGGLPGGGGVEGGGGGGGGSPDDGVPGSSLGGGGADPSARSARSDSGVECGAHLAALRATKALLLPSHPSPSEQREQRHPLEAFGDSYNYSCEESSSSSWHVAGRPATDETLASSSLWLLASLTASLLAHLSDEGVALKVAAAIEKEGLRVLFESKPGVKARRRAKVRDEIESCVALLDAALEGNLPPRPSPANPGAQARGDAADCLPTVYPPVYPAAPPPPPAAPAALAAPPPAAADKDKDKDADDYMSALLAQAAAEEAENESGVTTDKESNILESPVELRRCVAFINAVSALDATTFSEAPRFREVRRALEPLHKRFAARQSVGLCELNPVDPQLESAWFQPLSLKCDILVSKFAFKCNLYRYKLAILERERKMQLERERKARQKKQAYQDRRHRDTTLLRKGRINRLKAGRRERERGGILRRATSCSSCAAHPYRIWKNARVSFKT